VTFHKKGWSAISAGQSDPKGRSGAFTLMKPENQKTYHHLSTGTLELKKSTVHTEKSLFQVAERINPKRSFLFVSTVLGRHIPVRPRDHFAAVDRLVDQIPESALQGPLLVMGYAETAVGIGAAVARRIRQRRPGSDTLYLSTTRHPVDGRDWVAFSEGHSHATAHHVMSPSPQRPLNGAAMTLILVDDETTTGKTFAALFKAVRDGGLAVGRVLLLTFTDWSDGQAAGAIAEAAPDTPVDVFSLLHGAWRWERDAEATLPELPIWTGEAPLPVWTPAEAPRPLFEAPRLGLRTEPDAAISDILARLRPAPTASEAILVIGTGEHVWAPMLLAERLEYEGADVRFIATTRSPILSGDVIRHKISFPDHYGIGVPMYLHNVPPRPNERVIIMTETESIGICPKLLTYLGKGCIIDGAGRMMEFNEK
jgi:hypothetical protein